MRPGPTTRPGRRGSATSLRPACPSSPPRSGCRGRTRIRSPSRKPRADDRRLRRPLRPDREPDRDRLLGLGPGDHPRGGPRVVQRDPAGGSLGERRLCLAVRLTRGNGDRRQGHIARDDRRDRGRADPAQFLGPAHATSDPAVETYGYAASLELARAIAERAGDDALRRVWADAAAGKGAYQPPAGSAAAGAAEPETSPGPPDWRGLLDLLEAETGKDFVDLWQTWVVRPAELPLLGARARRSPIPADPGGRRRLGTAEGDPRRPAGVAV